MAAKKIKTTTVSKHEYASYLKKGQEFYDVMKTALGDGDWNTVLLLGVHAAISATDALLTFHAGKRSIGKSHQDAVVLLTQALPAGEDVQKNANRLAQILNEKHLVEYEPSEFTETQAYNFAQRVERFMDWVISQLPKR